MSRRQLSRSIVVTLSVGAACAPAGAVSSEQLSARYPRSMNARDTEHGTIYRDADGSCFVELPFEKPPTSGGMSKPRKAIDCPPIMRHEAWRECVAEEILSDEDGGECVCDVRGNPPPPTVPRVPCPRR